MEKNVMGKGTTQKKKDKSSSIGNLGQYLGGGGPIVCWIDQLLIFFLF